jgi:hypothetical protein
VRNDEEVYKVGKTTQASFKRVKSYGVGTELILIKQCIDSDAMETKILEEFNNFFPQYIFGKEYFVGSSLKMTQIIESILFQESLDSIGMDLQTFNLQTFSNESTDDVVNIDKIQKLSLDINKINKETSGTTPLS